MPFILFICYWNRSAW